jgi:hypothetical protein
MYITIVAIDTTNAAGTNTGTDTTDAAVVALVTETCGGFREKNMRR